MRKMIFVLTSFVLIIVSTKVANTQWLNLEWKRAVVPIFILPDSNYIPVATGFLFRHSGIPFLVTNKHVAQNRGLYIAFNLKSQQDSVLHISLEIEMVRSKESWKHSLNADISILRLNLTEIMIRYFDDLDLGVFVPSTAKKWESLMVGSDVYVLGFPMRLGAGGRFTPVYRSGIIALKEKEGEFLIDSNIFPGNSGGPVIVGPTWVDPITRIYNGNATARLAGIVSSYIAYTDIAVSPQTRRKRITFEENSGLANVYSIDLAIELIEDYLKTNK